MSELIFMKFGMYVAATEALPTAYFTTPSPQSVAGQRLRKNRYRGNTRNRRIFGDMFPMRSVSHQSEDQLLPELPAQDGDLRGFMSAGNPRDVTIQFTVLPPCTVPSAAARGSISSTSYVHKVPRLRSLKKTHLGKPRC
jgi:hypothetical protein